jgi:hypothetical protein
MKTKPRPTSDAGTTSNHRKVHSMQTPPIRDITYDYLLAAGQWAGAHAVLRRKIAEYSLDGQRLGGVPFPWTSPSIYDDRIDEKRAEVEHACYVLA